MFMHILYFKAFTEADDAEKWLLNNFPGLADTNTHDYEPYECIFYTAFPLSEQQIEMLVEILEPDSVMMNEEL